MLHLHRARRSAAHAAALLVVCAAACGGGSPAGNARSADPSARSGEPPAAVTAPAGAETADPKGVLAPGASAPAVSAPGATSLAKTGSQPPVGTAPSRVETRTFTSAALGVAKSYVAWLPRGYDDSTRRFPVVVMLHGLGGNERNWLEHGELAKVADGMSFPAIVVMPDGDASFYVDREATPADASCPTTRPPFNPGEPPATYCVKTPRYAAYVTRDLLHEIDARYRTLAKREARGIGGLSMGGFGALQLAMRNADRFAAVAAHSPLASLLYTGPRPFDPARVQLASSPTAWGAGYPAAVRAHVQSVLGPSIDRWKQHDPATLAAALAPGRLSIHVDCGTEDEFGFAEHARHLHHVLASRGVEHTFELAPGRHDFAYWKARLPRSLAFFAGALARD